MDEETMNPSEVFFEVLESGCTLDLTNYFREVVPANLLEQLAATANANNSNLMISGRHISRTDLFKITHAGKQNLTVRF